MTVSGVQRFIAESRKTSDLFAASEVMSALTAAMVETVDTRAVEVVMPSGADAPADGLGAGVVGGLPNRLVLLAPAGGGKAVAESLAAAVDAKWRAVLDVCGLADDEGGTPGFPAVQWVSVGPRPGGYSEQWAAAAAMMAARKRMRVFPGYSVAGRPLCSLTARWAARADSARGVAETLSTVAEVKRRYARTLGLRGRNFPSTASVATAPFRHAVATGVETDAALRAAVRALRDAVQAVVGRRADGQSGLPGLQEGFSGGCAEARWVAGLEGAWCFPESWEDPSFVDGYEVGDRPSAADMRSGRRAARELVRAAHDARIAEPSRYLAVIARDGDHMGQVLSDGPDGQGAGPRWHREVSAALVSAAVRQREVVEAPSVLGRLVYAGGDDLLALVPASAALDAVDACARVAADRLAATVPGLTVSTGVVFFHVRAGLQAAVAAAQELLHEAKETCRPGFGVAVTTSGGERVRVAARLSLNVAAGGPPTTVGALRHLVEASTGGMSGRLASHLERDHAPLAELPDRWQDKEHARLAGRHGAAAVAGQVLTALRAQVGPRAPERFALIARFLAGQGGLAGVGPEDSGPGRPDPGEQPARAAVGGRMPA